jgi:hypothetical protein
MANPLDVIHRRAAKRVRKFSARSAAAMQSEVGTTISRILRIAATDGRAAGLRALRRATEAARHRYEGSVGSAAISRAVVAVRDDVVTLARRRLVHAVAASPGGEAAKANLIAAVRGARLGRAGAAWERELAATVRRWGAVDASALYGRLAGLVHRAADVGPGASRRDLARLAQRGRDLVTVQAQISSRRAINTAVDRAGSLRAVATRAQARTINVDFYWWRTMGDDNVRDEHEARANLLFSFADSPQPGEEPNCRCSADLALDEVLEDQPEQPVDVADWRSREWTMTT